MRKLLKTTGIALLLIVLTVAGVAWYIACKLESIVQHELTEQVSKQFDGLYQFKVKQLKFSFTGRSLEAEGIQLQINQVVLDKLRKEDKEPKLLLKASLDKLTWKGVKLKELIQNKSLKCRVLSIDSLNVNVYQQATNECDSSQAVVANLYQHLHPLLTSVDIQQVKLQNGTLRYCSVNGSDSAVYHVENMSMVLVGVRIDSTSRTAFYCEDIQLEASYLSYIVPSKLYEWSLQRITVERKNGSLRMEHLKLKPRYTKHDFAQKDPCHSDRMELNVAQMNAIGFNLDSLFIARTLSMDSLMIQGVEFQSFKNKNVHAAKRTKPMFYSMLQKAPLGIRIKHASLTKGSVTYEELPLGKNTAGSICFNSISLKCTGLTNIASHKKQFYTIAAKAKLMNAGNMQVKFQLPVDSLNNSFVVSGSLSNMPLNALNKIMEPLVPARIKSGTIEKVDFTINGTSLSADINMLLLYNNLHVYLLREKNHYNRKLGFASRLVNLFVLKENNPPTGKQANPVSAKVYRNEQRSSFNYLWHSIFAGIKATMGVTEEKEQLLKDLQEKVKNIKARKQRRKEKRVIK